MEEYIPQVEVKAKEAKESQLVPKLAGLQRAIEHKQIDSKARKNRFLRTMLNIVKQNLATNNQFPDIPQVCIDLKMPLSKYREWLAIDAEFAKKFREIEDYYIERCQKRVYDASNEKGGGWIALEILKRKRKKEWGDELAVKGTFTNINLATPEWGEVEDASYTEHGENEALSRGHGGRGCRKSGVRGE